MTPDESKELFDFLHREGECWHEGIIRCQHCGSYDLDNPDFSTHSGFFWAWERTDKKKFIRWLCEQYSLPVVRVWMMWEGYTPEERVAALNQFRKEKNDGRD